jgi:hypothetical protein
MTEQNQTPDIADDEDTEGHGHYIKDDSKDDDAEGHVDRGTEDKDPEPIKDDTKDDDTEGHQHYR